MKLLLLGASGLVGGHVLDQALRDPRITRIASPVRRPLPPRDRLLTVVVDFETLPEAADWWGADAVICALGTTRRRAGSAQAFRRFDRDLVLSALRLARDHGTPTLALVSATGANTASPFLYSQVKGETECGAMALGFSSLTVLRPGLIGGARTERRPLERMAVLVAKAVEPVLPRGWRINPAERIAARLIEAAIAGTPGRHVVGPRELA